MLSKPNRLTKKNDFANAQKNGKVAGGAFLVLKYVQNGLEVTRVGFVVSKKVSNKAVIRNKAKRRLRESMRLHIANVISGYDLVFFTKPAVKNKTFDEIKVEVESLLKRARLIKISN